MRNSRLFWKLFLISIGMNLALAVVFVVVVKSSQRSEADRSLERRLSGIALVMRSHVSDLIGQVVGPDTQVGLSADGSGERDSASREASDKTLALSKLRSLVDRISVETKTRISVMDSQGDVLADSSRDPGAMLNHANREELKEANQSGRGLAARISPTLQVRMHYFALKIPFEGGRHAFVRIAVETDPINRQLATIGRALWLLAIVFGTLATLMIYAVVRRITRPIALLTDQAQTIAAGIDPSLLAVQSDDEVGQLAKAFNQMQLSLADRFRRLRMNNNQMSTVLGSMDEGIIAVDADQRILLANDASKSLLNFSSDDEVGRPLLEAVRNRSLYDVVQKCLETGLPVQNNFRSNHGSRRELAVRATCLPGEPANGVVMVLHDITELRRLENLRQEFVANVSHELKTPLASIKAYAETLRLGAMDDPINRRRFINCIEEQAERLHQLIMDMLQIARVESGEEAFEITAVSVQAVVDSCHSRHVENAHRKEIDLVIEPPTLDLQVVADEDGLDTILDNLIGNAIKYTPEGGKVIVRWRDAGDKDTGDYVVIEVQDTGIGIAAEHQTRVFERFYRADKARSRLLGGTGLGLSIVKHLAQSFNGAVTLVSAMDEGSTFRVRLPKSTAAA